MPSPTLSQDRETSPRERARGELLRTAERLFAEQGLDNVSLRQIATTAGYANPATIQYHFGSKEGLCEAIVEYRMPGIDARRLKILEQTWHQNLQGLVEAMARPLLEQDPDSHFVGFLGRIVGTFDEHRPAFEAMLRPEGGKRLRAAINALIGEVPPAVRSLRLSFATVLMVHAIAERQSKQRRRRQKGLSDADFERELFSAIAAVLVPESNRGDIRP